MAKKIKNREKLEEARKLLAEVILEEYGEEHAPKYINFEILSQAQAKKKEIHPGSVTISSSSKYGSDFVTLKVPIVTPFGIKKR